ncbi:CaiB/BaiF CoA transferase family protein [Candidimonas nitroreducens]|uniref:CoA transferase n=1 Tax=Candidimonas nitroreducens TaxID=683354 RepID=A0A225MI50_9BURK|nr:CoA transferase [Candidimonas nitroreducens]OWT59181.1 CoA transferase [Candidimonas nitroreducens]
MSLNAASQPSSQNMRHSGAPVDKRLPLAGTTIIDLTHVIAGPFASMTLADLGATVLKIENPGRGDTARGTPPHDEGISHFFAAVNRNKYSVALNLKNPQGKALLETLVKQADVVLHNFRPGVMEGLGLGYDDLLKLNPQLIYCAISGFGQEGPLRDRPAFDSVIQAMSGLMSLTGTQDGPPMRAGLSVGDYIPGLYAAMAVIVALRDRDRNGKGQFIDVSNFDCLFNIMGYYIPYYELVGKVPVRTGGAHPTVVPMGGFPTSDGYLVVAAFNQGFWRNLCRALGHAEWIDDPRYATLSTRAAHSEVLSRDLAAVMATRTTAEWEAIFAEHDVPCGPVLNVADLVNHPQVEHRQLVGKLGVGKLRAPMRPIKYQHFEQSVRLAPPHLGEDTVAILSRFNCVDPDKQAEQLAAWAATGVIQDPTLPMPAKPGK